MAALTFSRSAGPRASGPWGLSRCILLLLLPLLTSDSCPPRSGLLPQAPRALPPPGDQQCRGPPASSPDAQPLPPQSMPADVVAETLAALSGPGQVSRFLFSRRRRPLRMRCGQASLCGRPWWSEDLDVTRHWPWEVSLRLENEHICGGALIELNWVVTAAHCIQGTKEYSVILGTSKLKPLQPALIPVKDIVMHPKFWGRTFIMGDVALLQLHSPATFSKYVQPICLPEPSYNLKVGTQCWVTGWGQVKQRFSANSTLTAELQEAEVFIMDNEKCDQIYRKKSPIPHLVPLVLGDMICATNYGENLCSGDSGGPLACEVEGRWILAGVLSWEKACAKAENPGVYTRVTKYSKWIKKQISSGALSGPQTSAWFLLLFWLLQPQMGP
ncbi:PREDICTED: serine protease 45 [Odobenus rosmarus divergens]|uniref:Serine protease 45 n=1 Tax=Odobenus rosmarus divergens TaxID=9708 RepID=A0A9B0LN19_ODORO